MIDLENVACYSMQAKMSLKELELLLSTLGMNLTQEQWQVIHQVRKDIRIIDQAQRLGFV